MHYQRSERPRYGERRLKLCKVDHRAAPCFAIRDVRHPRALLWGMRPRIKYSVALLAPPEAGLENRRILKAALAVSVGSFGEGKPSSFGKLCFNLGLGLSPVSQDGHR